MATDPWLFATIRTLLKRVRVLEAKLQTKKIQLSLDDCILPGFQWNPLAPEFCLSAPAGIHCAPETDAATKPETVNELLKNDCDNEAATLTTSLQLPFSADDLNDALLRAQAVLDEFVLPRGVSSRGSEETSFEYWKFPEENLVRERCGTWFATMKMKERKKFPEESFVHDSVQLAFEYSKFSEENYVNFSDSDSDGEVSEDDCDDSEDPDNHIVISEEDWAKFLGYG